MTQASDVMVFPGRRRDAWLPASLGGRAFWWLALVVAVALRFHGLGRECFWLDEVFSARIDAMPFREIIHNVPKDKPPLDYYVQALFRSLGRPEFWHRFPEAVAGVALVVGIYFFALAWLGRHVALVAFTLAALNPFLIRYAQDARPYSLFMALIVWQQVAFVAWHQSRRRGEGGWPFAASLTLLSILSLYALYAAVAVFAAEAAFLLALLAMPRADWARWRATGIYLAVMALTFLAAWPLYSRAPVINDPSWGVIFKPVTTKLLASYVAEYACYNVDDPFAWAGAAALLTLTALGIWTGWRRQGDGTLQVALSSLLPLPATLAFYAYIKHDFFTRYACYCLPGILLFAALGIQRLAFWAWLAARGVSAQGADRIALALAVAIGAVAWMAYDAGIPYNEDWREVARYLAKNGRAGDVVGVQDYNIRDPLSYYLERAGAAGRFRVIDQNSPESQAWHGPIWAIFQRYGSERNQPGQPFCGLTVERQGVAPGAKLRDRLARMLGPGPELLLGRHSSKYLGYEWDFPETWRPNFTIRSSPTLMLGRCSPELLGYGWSPPETWGPNLSIRWAMRRDVTLWLPLAGDGAGRLTIFLMSDARFKASPQTLQPSLDGRKLGVRVVPTGMFSELSWNAPASLKKDEIRRLDLEFAWTHSFNDKIPNSFDRRSLAAAVLWVRWERLPSPAPSLVGPSGGR